MAEQISFFAPENETNLEVIEMAYVSKRYTCVEELFQGFNHLYAITFSYGLDFVRKIVDYFDTAEIILGCEGIVKFDAQTVMAFQTRTLEELRKYDSLIERASNGTFAFRVARGMLLHEKIFILASDSGRTRIIYGSANFSGRSFSGNQREMIGYIENDPVAFEAFMDEFQTAREFSSDEIVKDCLYVNSTNSDELNVENIPIVNEIKVRQAGVILDNNIQDEGAVDFIYDINSLSAKYGKVMPKLKSQAGLTLITSQNVKEFIRKHSNYIAEQKIKQARYPQFRINYTDGTFSFDDKPYHFDTDLQQVREDIIHINDYFQGFNAFIGDVEEMKEVYFRVMNYMFLSPFIAQLRSCAYRADFPTTLFPMYAIINGPKSAGKSAFMDTVQHIMFGRELKGVDSNIFTKSGILGVLHESTGVPTHIEELSRERFNKYAGEIVKFDTDILKEKLTNHPVFIATSNDIETMKKDLSKRVYYASVNGQLTNVSAVSSHRKMVHLRKQISTSFYREYLKRMYPKVMDLINEMSTYEYNEERGNWKPDIFAVSSWTILDIYHDCNFDPPEYVQELTYSDYFGYNDLTNKIRNKIIFEWNHNRKAFNVMRKRNLLEYTAGEKSYEALRVRDALPEELRADISGVKVVMLLDQAEKFFGIRFSKRIFEI